MFTPRFRRSPGVLLLAATLITSASFLPAQTAPAPSGAAASNTAKPAEEVVTLSAFEVSAGANRGYVTTSSMSASRIAVPITELPSSVVVINEKLIADTMATSLQDTLSLVSGIQQSAPPQGSNEISMRGYTLAGAQRDGVTDYLVSQGREAGGGFDYALVERIEIVKGPAGILYGAHNPGGIINLVSKRPLSRPKTRINVMAGSYESYRAELDTSQFIDAEKRFGYRIVALWADTAGQVDDRPQAGDGIRAFNPSLSFRSKNGWYAWAWAAIVRDHLRRSTFGTPALPTEAGFSFPSRPSTTGAPLYEVAGNHMLSNLQYTDTDTYELGVSKDFKLGPVELDVRLLGRDYRQRGEQASRIRGVDAFDILVDRNGSIIGTDFRAVPLSAAAGKVGQIGRAAIRYDSNPVRLDGQIGSADFNFGFDVGPTRHQLLAYVTVGRQESRSNVSSYDIRNAATLASLGVPIIGGRPVVVYWPKPIVTPSVEDMVRLADTRNIANDIELTSDEVSYGAIERLSFWDNRIIAVGGVRRDALDGRSVSIVNNAPVPRSQSKDRETTTALSALAKVYKGSRGEVSLFVNGNETFIPVTTIDRRLATFGQKYPNRIASNDEFGLKLDTFQSRLVATLSIFKTTETNVLVTENDETGAITGIPSTFYQTPVGTRTTKGWEIDLNFAPREGWELILAYSDVDPRLETGRYAQKIAFDTFTAAVRHEVRRGWAKGLSAMWQYNHWGESALSSRSYWIIPGGEQHTAILSYHFGGRWTARVRVENVFDERHVYPSANETALDITRDRNYRVGLTYEF